MCKLCVYCITLQHHLFSYSRLKQTFADDRGKIMHDCSDYYNQNHANKAGSNFCMIKNFEFKGFV